MYFCCFFVFPIIHRFTHLHTFTAYYLHVWKTMQCTLRPMLKIGIIFSTISKLENWLLGDEKSAWHWLIGMNGRPCHTYRHLIYLKILNRGEENLKSLISEKKKASTAATWNRFIGLEGTHCYHWIVWSPIFLILILNTVFKREATVFEILAWCCLPK